MAKTIWYLILLPSLSIYDVLLEVSQYKDLNCLSKHTLQYYFEGTTCNKGFNILFYLNKRSSYTTEWCVMCDVRKLQELNP